MASKDGHALVAVGAKLARQRAFILEVLVIVTPSSLSKPDKVRDGLLIAGTAAQSHVQILCTERVDSQ